MSVDPNGFFAQSAATPPPTPTGKKKVGPNDFFTQRIPAPSQPSPTPSGTGSVPSPTPGAAPVSPATKVKGETTAAPSPLDIFAQRAADSPPAQLLGKASGVADRGRQAVQATLTTPNSEASKVPWYSTPGVSMLDPGSTDPIDRRVRHAITVGVPPKQDAAHQNKIMDALSVVHIPDNPLTRFFMNTGTDPLMWTGDLPAAGLRATEAGTLPGIMRGLSLLERINPGVASVARKTFEMIHDLPGVDSATKRALASAFGNRWVQEYGKMSAVRAASRSFGNEFGRQFGEHFGEILHGLRPEEEAAVYDAIDKGAVDLLPENLLPKAQQLESLTDDLFFLEAEPAAREDMISNGYRGLPDWAKKLDTGTAKAPAAISSFRGKYVPGMRPISATTGGPRRISEITRQDPFLQPRDEPLPKSAFEPGAVNYFRDAFQRRFAAAGRNVASGEAERKLLQQFGGESFEQLPEHVKEFFNKTVVGDRGFNPLNRAADFGKAAIDLQKGSIFWNPTRHMGNIGFLSVLHDIGATPGVIKEYAKTAAMNPTQRFEHFAPEIANGVVQVGGDRSSAFVSFLQKLGGGPQTDAKWSSILRNAAGAPFRIAGNWYSFAGDQLWKFDDAAKAVAFRRNTQRFMADAVPRDTAEALAAHEVNASLVDYNTRSALADALSYVAPFSTWRTKMPMAVARGVIKSPGVAAAMYRASPASFGGEGQLPSGKVEKSSLPGAEFSNVVQDIGSIPGAIGGLMTGTESQHPLSLDYPIGTLGWWPRIAGNLIAAGTTKGNEPYPFTYGHTNKAYLKSQIPFVGPAGQFTGQGLFPQSPQQALMQSLTGYYAANPAPPPGAQSKKDAWVAAYMQANPNASIYDAYKAYQYGHH